MYFHLLNMYKRVQIVSTIILSFSYLTWQTALVRASDSISTFDFQKTEGEKLPSMYKNAFQNN